MLATITLSSYHLIVNYKNSAIKLVDITDNFPRSTWHDVGV